MIAIGSDTLRQGGGIVQGGRRSVSGPAVFVTGGGLERGGLCERPGWQVGVFFNALLRSRQGAEQEELGGWRMLFAGILTAIRVRRQARVLVRLVLSGFLSAPVSHVRVGSCTRWPPRTREFTKKKKKFLYRIY